MIAIKTDMRFLPANCAECICTECLMPRKNGQVQKRYTNCRHSECPLRDVYPVPENRKHEGQDLQWITPEKQLALALPITIEYIHADQTTFTPKVVSVCYGDLVLTANAMFDYADILDNHRAQCIDKDAQPVEWFQREYYANRFRQIGTSIADQLGYDRLLALEKCKNWADDNDDVGEDAMVLAVKAAKKQAEVNDEKNRPKVK